MFNVTTYDCFPIHLVDISFAIVFIVLDEVWKMLCGIFCHFVTPVTVIDREQAGVGVVLQNGIVCVLKQITNMLNTNVFLWLEKSIVKLGYNEHLRTGRICSL